MSSRPEIQALYFTDILQRGRRLIFCGLLAGAVLASTVALAQSPSEHFKSGVEAFQKGEVDKARAEFQETLKIDPDNVNALYNIGMIEMKAGRTGMALGLWRKALVISPGLPRAARAEKWAIERLERREIAHDSSLWESYRSIILEDISTYEGWLATFAFLFTSGWLWLGHFGARRRALLDDKPSPSFPTAATISTFFLIIFIVVTISKIVDTRTVRATVVEKKIEARSSPGETATTLFELFEGLEVVVRQRSNDWTQVTYPGGPTGWVPSKSILATNDRVIQ